MTKEHIEAAYTHTIRNRAELRISANCSCIACQTIFSANEIDSWIDGGETAICPYCGTDAVIGDASGYEMSASFLQEMNVKYF